MTEVFLMLMSTLNIYLFIHSCILSTKTCSAPGPESGTMGAGAAKLKTQLFLQDLTVLRIHGKMCWCNSILSFFEVMKKEYISLSGALTLGLGG